jgi:hypothetical protein
MTSYSQFGGVCEWRKQEDGRWTTTCKADFEFAVDGPDYNGFRFCPYCAGDLKEVSDELPTL